MDVGSQSFRMVMGNLDNLKQYRILLCSGSPRRRELLAMTGIPFEVRGGLDVDESVPQGYPAEEVPEILALRKAAAYSASAAADDLIISADTVVIIDNMILGKPADEEDACRMLRLLSGRVHQVVTGVAVTAGNRTESFSVKTEVEFDHLDDSIIDQYVTRFRPLDKAGAYGIQEWIGAVGVLGINGSFYNVMGLPVQRLYALLRTF